MQDLTGRVAAITGAASGIGRALAEQLAAAGCHLALSDIDDAGLAETVSRCEGRGVKVTAARVDVADREAVIAWADQVVAEHGKVNLVCNNAGVAVGFTVETMSYEDLDWLLGINLGGVLNGTKAFLPHLRASGEGHVVNVSSVFGLIGVPTQSAYNAAKFGVRGFTEALRLELKIDRSPVSCTVVHPGGVNTNIVRSARMDPEAAMGRDPVAGFEKLARTSPDDAAAAILRAVRKDKRRVVIGRDGKVIDLLSRLPAGLYHWPVIVGGRLGNRGRKR